MARTKQDKGCRLCIATATECEECKNKSNYREAEKPKCASCKWCNTKAFHRGKWYCSNPNVSVFEPPYSFDDCYEQRKAV